MKKRRTEGQLGFDFTFPLKKNPYLLSVDELFDELSTEICVDMQENLRIERKSVQYNARSLGDYFSMWANTPPDGGL